MAKLNNRGMFFSTDALIALSIILMILVISYPTLQYFKKVPSVQYDMMNVLSDLKVGEINNSYVKTLIASGRIENLNNSILKQIGEFYVSDEVLAREFANEVLGDLVVSENYGLWYENSLIYLSNQSPYSTAENVYTARQRITGIKQDGNVTGFAARSFLSKSKQTSYFYFGGYVGDGNISFYVNYSGNISSAMLELAISNNFSLFVNGISQGNFSSSGSESPSAYVIPVDDFNSGLNVISLNGSNLYISGGYFKITYDPEASYSPSQKYFFPGIQGVINLYDGFYFPGSMSGMNIFLHFNSSNELVFNIGNITIFNGSSSESTSIYFNDSSLSSLLDYNLLKNKTVPIRMGILNLTLGGNFTGNADVILITDTSGSMDWRLDVDGGTSYTRSCSDANLYNSDTKRISLAKCIDKDFISTILQGKGNRVGLVSFSSNANNFVNLTTNQSLLNSTIDSYSVTGGTCISCALNRAYELLASQNLTNRSSYIIMMSDGVPNYRSTSSCFNSLSSSQNSSFVLQVGSSAESTFFSSYWQVLSSPVSSNLNSISLLNSSFGFAVGGSGNILRFNGSEWSSVSSPIADNLLGVDIYNSTLAFAVGDSGKILNWTGISWSQQIDIGTSSLRSVNIYNSTLAFAVGDSGIIYRWNGSSWSLYQDIGTSNLYSVEIVNSTFAFATGSSGKVYFWNGATWSEYVDLGSSILYSIKFLNNSRAFVSDNSGEIYSWNGSNWAQVYSSSYALYSLVIVNSSLAYAFGDSLGGMVVFNGVSWQKDFPSYLFQGTLNTGLSCSDDSSCSNPSSISSMNSNWSSCRVHDDFNTTVHAVGFGPVSSCSLSSQTLQSIATCGNGSYYASTNATLLNAFYQQIAGSIVNLSYVAQVSRVFGSLASVLYPDSYIEILGPSYSNPFGLNLFLEKQFDNSSFVTFSLPENSSLVKAEVFSYSSSRWTSLVKSNSSFFYNLSNYGNSFTFLGDPFVFRIPNNLVANTTSVVLNTGYSPSNMSMSGSSYNKVIYQVVKNFSSYSGISSSASGCVWNISFFNGSSSLIRVPSNYLGGSVCNYNSLGISYNSNDAFQSSAYRLFRDLDFDSDNRIDIFFSSQDLDISSSEFSGIPFTWSTEVEVRSWD